MSHMPRLNPEEHKELERAAGRPLTNDEAQMLRRERVLIAAFADWLEVRTVVDAGKRQAEFTHRQPLLEK